MGHNSVMVIIVSDNSYFTVFVGVDIKSLRAENKRLHKSFKLGLFTVIWWRVHITTVEVPTSCDPPGHLRPSDNAVFVTTGLPVRTGDMWHRSDSHHNIFVTAQVWGLPSHNVNHWYFKLPLIKGRGGDGWFYWYLNKKLQFVLSVKNNCQSLECFQFWQNVYLWYLMRWPTLR